MNNKFHTKMLLEASYLTAITVIFALIGLYIPSMSIFTMFLTSIPLIILTIKTNGRMALASIAVSYILIIIFTGQIIIATITLFSFCFSGLAIGYGLKQKWQFNKILIVSSAAYLISLLATILFISSIEGINQIEKLILTMKEYLDKSGTIFNDILSKNKNFANNSTVDMAKDVQVIIDNAYKVIRILIPGLFIISSAFMGYITIVLSKSVLNRIGYDYKYLPKFHQLKVSKTTTVGFIIFLILAFVSKEGKINSAFINIAYILSMFLIFYGISIVDFFVKRQGIPGVLRVIIYVISFTITTAIGSILPFLSPINILLMLAFADSIFDFRKLDNKGENHG